MHRWTLVYSFGLAATLAACGGTSHSGSHVANAREAASAQLDLRAPNGNALRQIRLAMFAMDEGLYQRAIELLDKARLELPHNAILLHELALAYRLNHQPKLAVALLGPYRGQLPAELLASYGSALDESGKRQDAEVVLRAGIAKHPGSGLLHSELGTLLSNSGRVPEAIEQFEVGIKVEPQVPSNYFNAARLLAHGPRRGMSLVYGEVFRLL
jgi:tetratricopeptide (TPR) repeat protein